MERSETTRTQLLLVRLGVLAWSVIGIVVVIAFAVSMLAAVGAVVLPLIFAVVLATIFRPAARWLEQRGMPAAAASAGIVLLLVAAAIATVALTVHGIVDQLDRIGEQVDAALAEAGLDADQIADVRAALEELTPVVSSGLLTLAIASIDAVAGVAAGAVIGALLMYFLLKDATVLRSAVVEAVPSRRRNAVDAFVGETCRILRSYARARSVLSALVAIAVGLAAIVLGVPLVPTIVMVNFIGGFVPYIGAVLGGALAVAVALADGGVATAVVMLLVVLAANLVLENFVEPRVMGARLEIHPALVLLLTTLGGIVGGLVGLMLAVPAALIGTRALGFLLEAVEVPAGETSRPTA